MFKGFYTAASSMVAQQRQLEMMSNNLSNVNTPGYKTDKGALRAFPELLLERMGEKQHPVMNRQLPTRTPVGALNTGVYLQETMPMFSQGDIEETGRDVDLAIFHHDSLPDEAGAVLFTVQNEAGEPRYTRNGSLQVDGDGFLVTAEGRYLLNTENAPIQVAPGSFQVSSDGVVTDSAGNVSTLNMAYSADPQAELVREGNGLWRAEGGALAQATVGFSVLQGSVERSNVNLNETMTGMMEAYRMFEAGQRVVRAYDQSMGKAVNDVGKIG
ncbi:flagellar hook-basal body protein [Bacillaceae bacterium SIJ1]|uniref:flagellar hook-basal body protein n=1 Tax=Litoribacterium kuwaitense TaxID=1398745 RepID=UPI0013EC16DF|nr:flagellar hook-basal body protein [Litoribacterium kuwaitense]NGP44758.1 flagellar hook-basal body protein [Litoribacterium kuwaitense]